MKLKLCAPCLFGLEGLVGNELRHMGMEKVEPENGRVCFVSDELGTAAANIRSRFAERILIELGRFHAGTFDELFEGVRALPLEQFIPRDGAFPVKGFSLNSALHSVPDCQSIIKKAAASRLGKKYGREWLPETGPVCRIQFSIMKDEAVVYLDTSGEGLHKRGYRPAHAAASLRETLAAAMVDIAGYRGRGEFRDPFCGAGTIAVEAALAAKNRAPGLRRGFSAQEWPLFPKRLWEEAAEEARSREFRGEYRILGTDKDPEVLELARANCVRAGVEDCVRFEQADACSFSDSTEKGFIVTNPPYGERLLDLRAAEKIYSDFGAALRGTEGWKLCLLSADEEFERAFGSRADRKRKLYNGTIKCQLYIYGSAGKR